MEKTQNEIKGISQIKLENSVEANSDKASIDIPRNNQEDLKANNTEEELVLLNLKPKDNSSIDRSIDDAGDDKSYSESGSEDEDCEGKYLSGANVNTSAIQIGSCKSKHSKTKISRIPQEDDDKPDTQIVSVIVTIYASESYDNLFRSVKQKSSEGKVRLYSLNLFSVGHLFKILTNQGNALGEEDNTNFIQLCKELIEDISQVDSNCVLFNYECCSTCDDGKVTQDPYPLDIISMTKHCLDKGYMVMFSDFAVKMLIKIWNEDILGPNPLVNIGECSGNVKLEFDTKVLKDSPSKQLQMVGELSDKGIANVHALGGTIVIGHDMGKLSNANFNFSVLTYVTSSSKEDYFSDSEEGEKKEAKDKELTDYRLLFNEKNASVGHAMFKYPSGGVIIVSATHWIELNKLDVSEDNLKVVAKCNYGSDYDDDIRSIERERSVGRKRVKLSKLANRFVQQSVPCKENKRK
jgi:hypothetical protein